MPTGLGASLGLGGGRSATSSGALAGGGDAPLLNAKSVIFDGSNDHVAAGVPAGLSASDPITISAWINATAAEGENPSGIASWNMFVTVHPNQVWAAVEGKGRSLGVYGTSKKVAFNTWVATPVYGTTVLVPGTWYHVAATCTAANESGLGTAIIYVNGKSEGTGTTKYNDWTVTPDLYIARGFATYYGGYVDEVGIWDSVLTAQQIMNIAKGGASSASKKEGDDLAVGSLSTFSPLCWYRMGDGDTYATLTDHGSAGEDGTMTNMADVDIVETVPNWSP